MDANREGTYGAAAAFSTPAPSWFRQQQTQANKHGSDRDIDEASATYDNNGLADYDAERQDYERAWMDKENAGAVACRSKKTDLVKESEGKQNKVLFSSSLKTKKIPKFFVIFNLASQALIIYENKN